MIIQNFEFKASVNNIVEKEEILLQLHPLFIGEDHQIDTYFNVPKGRLKLREGNIENALIQYERNNIADSKLSSGLLYQHTPDSTLKQILIETVGIKAIVDKQRKIYFIDNVKFHFDTVEGLGTFIEVEAIDKDGNIGIEKLKNQCETYAKILGVHPTDFIANSYSDMLIEQKKIK
jgi:adenylate cyclase class 2